MNWFVKGCAHLLFPATCVGCQKDLRSTIETVVCGACRSKITWDFPLDSTVLGPVDDFYAATLYSSPLKEILHAFKYRGKDYLAPFLVDIWMCYWPASFHQFDAIVPVPMPYWRETVRGYNQAALLARELGARLNIPLNQRLLRRRWTQSQTKLNRHARLDNARRGFQSTPGAYERTPQRVLLVDDVSTTGATLNVCGTILKEVGVKEVFATSLARERLLES